MADRPTLLDLPACLGNSHFLKRIAAITSRRRFLLTYKPVAQALLEEQVFVRISQQAEQFLFHDTLDQLLQVAPAHLSNRCCHGTILA